MKKLVILVAMVVFGLSASPAFGQATRTWVSGVGDDANPCSRTAPCKTFAGAISKTAVGGIIDAMDDGGFGAVTITKSITIDGGSHTAGLLASGGINAVNINLQPPVTPDIHKRVVLRNLSIEGNGTTLGLNGVNVTASGAGYGPLTLELENVRISHFSRHGIFVAPNSLFQPEMSMLLNNVVSSDNGTGGVGSNGFEIAPTDGTRKVNALVQNSVFKGSRANPGVPDVGIGIAADTGAHVWLSNTSVFDNAIGLKTFNRATGGAAGIFDSFCDNQIGGNVDNGTPPNELCPQPPAPPAPAPAPAPTIVTEIQTVQAPVQCIVPSLKGLTVSFAKRLLKAAHCALGKVTKKKAAKSRQIGKITAQKTKAGTALADGAKVNVTVGRRR